MKTNFLFPHKYKKVGWILFIPSFVILILSLILDYNLESHLELNVFAIYQESIGNKPGFFMIIKDYFMYELISILLIVGGLLINFSKLKNEDEYTMQIRYESLVWAVYINYALLLLYILFIYGFPFITVVVLNLYSVLIFFMIRFHYSIYLLNKSVNYEE